MSQTQEQLAAIAQVRINVALGREQYAGMSTHQISAYNRYLMFGENDEAFPSDGEWARIVD